MKRWALILASTLAFAGCDLDAEPEENEPAFSNCAFGSLKGDWAFHYEQTSGDCGQVSDHEGLLDEDRPIAGCRVDTSRVSSDKCQLDLDLSCPTSDGLGTQTWSLRMRHVATDQLEGNGSLKIEHPTGVCQSSYRIEINQISE